MANIFGATEKTSKFIDNLDSYINILYCREDDDMSNENLLEILANLIDILNDMKVIENKFRFVNYGKDEQIGSLERYMKSSVFKFGKDSEKVLIDSKKQIEYQYDYSVREYKRSELLANVMNLSNIIAHRIQEFYERGVINQTHSIELENKCTEEGIRKCNIQELIDEFFYLKEDCIEELVNCQENGENMDIYSYKDEQGRMVVGVWIPQYFEPISVHCLDNNPVLDDIEELDENPYPNRTTFSFRVTPEQEEIFEWLAKTQWEGINARRIYAYLEAKRKFQKREDQNNIQQNEVNNDPINEITVDTVNAEQDVDERKENNTSGNSSNINVSESTYHMLTELLLQKRASTEEKRKQVEMDLQEAQRILEEAQKKYEEAMQKMRETEREWEEEEKALKELGIKTNGEDEKGYE